MALEMAIKELNKLMADVKGDPNKLLPVYSKLLEIQLMVEEMTSLVESSLYEEIPYPGMHR